MLALVREHGGRATAARRFLLEALFERPGHLTAEQLCEAVRRRAPDVHVSTVYRNLEELQRLGVVVHTHFGHGPVTYQLAAAAAHGHFLCSGCGALVEAPDELFAGLAKAARSELGFRIDPHHMAILGHCASCA